MYLYMHIPYAIAYLLRISAEAPGGLQGLFFHLGKATMPKVNEPLAELFYFSKRDPTPGGITVKINFLSELCTTF